MENQNTDNKKGGFLQGLKDKMVKKEAPFTAEACYIQSKYGVGSFKPIEERIADKQAHIRRTIREKFAPSINDNLLNYSSFHAVVDIEEDLANHTEEIFQPFLDGGFEIINLSKECKSIDSDTHIYLISWKNIFKGNTNTK